MQILSNTNYNFIRWRWHALALSTLVIAAGVAIIVSRGGMPMGIDFSGGTIVVVKFDQPVTEQQVRGAVDPIPGEEGVQQYGDAGDNGWLIRRARPQGRERGANLEAGSQQILDALTKAGLPSYEILSREIVGPVTGADLQRRGLYATLASILAITIYIGFRFRFSFAIGAIAATLPDIIVTLASLVFFGCDLSLPIVAAPQPATGHSVSGTSVTSARGRESMRSMRKESLRQVVNTSVNRPRSRTCITAGTTFLSVLTLYVFGGEGRRRFAFTMLVR